VLTLRLFGQILAASSDSRGTRSRVVHAAGHQEGRPSRWGSRKGGGGTEQDIDQGGSRRPGTPTRLPISNSACAEGLVEGSAAYSGEEEDDAISEIPVHSSQRKVTTAGVADSRHVCCVLQHLSVGNGCSWG
jgi:hypothetical protein